MTGADHTQLVGPALASALAAKGYHTLTPVQEAVLDDALEGRDLRITSQTGSGKTIAIGFAVRDLLDDLTTQFGGVARPRVLVLTPTRELAKQVAEELAWLYAPLRVRVAAVTGGAGYIDQKRALASNPAVIVATPGRLRDALERGKIDSTALAAVVLDEADSMLDLGFREDLEAILAKLPKERRSHLVSATFSRDVVSLADRFQRDPVHVQGTVLGEANVDIEHVVHLVEPGQRVDALINLLLADEDAKSLVFVRTRADVARIAGELAEAGFVVRTLSGEMEQAERDRALAAFRQGGVQALVATDVAARGIDVRDIARVIQVEPPSNVETYTHRSGRTGRAGKQGTSVLFVAPPHYPAIARGLARARIAHRVEPVPRPDAIQRAREEKLVAWLAREGDGDTIDPHALSIAERIVASGAVLTALARLVEKAGLHGPTKARNVRAVPPPRDDQPVRARRPIEGPRPVSHANPDGQRPFPPGKNADVRRAPPREESADGRNPARRPQPPGGDPAWVTFRVTWGGLHGADARRLLAVACRRGNIRGTDVGAIRVEAAYSLLDIARDVAGEFEAQAGKPDPRDPRVRITRADEAPRVQGPAPRAQDRPSPRVEERSATRVEERPAPRGQAQSEAPATEEPRPRPRPRVEERPVRPHVPHRAAKPERPRPAGPRTHAESDRRQRRGGDAPVRRPRKA
jgi:ATP-dependent RNA helicase DeaD